MAAGDGKQGVRAVRGKRSLQQFMHDLQQVVVEGKCTAEHQYLLEAENEFGTFYAYLFWAFGEFDEAQSTVSHKMADNHEVMKRWKRTTGRTTKKSIEGYLRAVWEQI